MDVVPSTRPAYGRGCRLDTRQSADPTVVFPINRASREAAHGPLVLDTRQRVLVVLLMAGHTDTSAARRLHVSPRTVTNMLRTLMDQLGVNNRFQLGIAIGQRSIARPVPSEPGARCQCEGVGRSRDAGHGERNDH
jgi:DNA-binding CsgD family transcriptional regulator